MARLIDADALKKELAPQDDWSWKNGAYVRDMIDSAPITHWMPLPEPPKEEDDDNSNH